MVTEKPREQDSQSEMSSQPQQTWHAGGKKEGREAGQEESGGERREKEVRICPFGFSD